MNFKKSYGEEIIQPQNLEWAKGSRMLLVANDKFRLEVLEFSIETSLPSPSKEKIFQIVHILLGEFEVDSEMLHVGETFLITAEGMQEDIRLKPISTEIKLAVMSVGSDWITYL